MPFDELPLGLLQEKIANFQFDSTPAHDSEALSAAASSEEVPPPSCPNLVKEVTIGTEVDPKLVLLAAWLWDHSIRRLSNNFREILYVELYVQYLLEDSIKNQFVPFNKGFQQVCGGDALQLCHYEELELIICGLPHFDFEALEKVTIYHGGYTKDSNIVKWFWKLVKETSLEEKKSLLFFTTGNDRAPVGGLGSLQFIIQRNDGETDRLPTAHTCFNVLLLPE
ncbi:hypothetical protein L7F22_005702 [Adiantum nelumboides]|nr:hypothetical protein [Adiantum nelumboides]